MMDDGIDGLSNTLYLESCVPVLLQSELPMLHAWGTLPLCEH